MCANNEINQDFGNYLLEICLRLKQSDLNRFKVLRLYGLNRLKVKTIWFK